MHSVSSKLHHKCICSWGYKRAKRGSLQCSLRPLTGFKEAKGKEAEKKDTKGKQEKGKNNRQGR